MLRLATAVLGLRRAAAQRIAPSPKLSLTGARIWPDRAGTWYPEERIDRETALRTRTVENGWATGRKREKAVLTVLRGRIAYER